MDTKPPSWCITRGQLLRAGPAALGAAALAACGLSDLRGGAPATAQKVTGTLELWGHSLFPFDQDVGADAVRQLQAHHPGLSVNFTPANDADAAKLRIAVAGGTPPDLVTVNGIEVQGLALEGVTTSLEGYLKTSRAIKKTDIWAPFVQDVTWKGAMFGLPYGPDLRILYVNADRYARAGLNPNAPPKTWAEVQQNVAKTLERDGSAVSVLGFDPFIGSGLFNLWLVPFWQLGGELLSADGTKVTIVGDRSLGAWQWIKQLIDQQGGWAAVTAFRQGRMPQQIFADGYMSHFYGTNSERSEQFNRIAPGLKFGVGTFPLPPNGRRTSFGGLWTWVMPKEFQAPRRRLALPGGSALGREQLEVRRPLRPRAGAPVGHPVRQVLEGRPVPEARAGRGARTQVADHRAGRQRHAGRRHGRRHRHPAGRHVPGGRPEQGADRYPDKAGRRAAGRQVTGDGTTTHQTEKGA